MSRPNVNFQVDLTTVSVVSGVETTFGAVAEPGRRLIVYVVDEADKTDFAKPDVIKKVIVVPEGRVLVTATP